MKTLYELLDALPEDDADGLRAAFRKAAKASHPDNNPGDPDAPLRFRRIVRANAILSDERQRAHYDRLLAAVLRERRQKLRERRLNFVLAGGIFLVVLIGGHLLFGYGSKASLVAAQVIEVSRREPARAAAPTSTQLSDTIDRDRSRDGRDDIGAPNTPENPEAAKETAAPNVTAPVESTDSAPATANVPPTRDFGAKDARDNEISGREPALAAALTSTQLSDTIDRDHPRADIGVPNTPENPEAAKETATPNVTAPVESTDSAPAAANVPPARDFGAKDARDYRERGILAYRNGDIYLALADFDLAIELNPHFSEAYIDRGVVFYRMGDFNRAFADIAQAKRIDDSNRSQTPPPEPRKTARR